jgi:glycosyltransferase involved in cell wall biosynthesis
MLGWEYPPHISGGLGTACEGLTTALARNNVEITFVVPHCFGEENAPHMRLVDASRAFVQVGAHGIAVDPGVSTFQVPSFLAPYLTPETYKQLLQSALKRRAKASKEALLRREAGANAGVSSVIDKMGSTNASFARYGGDIFSEVARYTSEVVARFAGEPFDIIHAHDWMTYPAAVALAEVTKKPLVLHVHSVEFDRAGSNGNPQINQIERWGTHAADAVIAVSYYTRAVVSREHQIPLEKIHVVHNGVYPREVIQKYRGEQGWTQKVVLFMGRITFQKGPEYFVEAAAKVVPHVPDVLFVMAGSGDMLQRMIDRVYQLGIQDYFRFPGFLRGQEVEQIYSLADVYVMPSVSEPFGIAALEAISFDTPVIISRQSGVSEVLGHALKVDFWDVDRLADLIINALLHEELRADMVAMAREELKRLRWDAAAAKTTEVYKQVLGTAK